MLFLLAFFPALQAQEKLSLENAVNMALKNNFDISIANNSSTISKVNNTSGKCRDVAYRGNRWYRKLQFK